MATTEHYQTGQRWVSESEPELGLGLVRRVGTRTVTIAFGASGESREYARDNAPLKRVRFRVGDKVQNQQGQTIAVRSVTERNGLIIYGGNGQELCESELNDALSFSKPEERLLAGQLDSLEMFDLRVAALKHQHHRRKSKVRGFVGGRIELIPHQLYIAAEVSSRLNPRVLLADEVGLGKTIEACLILHRLILTGRAHRVLILVPDSLVHQWFVELLRRFNLWFHIFDEERCEAIEMVNPESNPFLDGQLVLCSLSLFTKNEARLQQALAAGWDMLVVDEAHHLGWAPDAVSPEYAVVEAISRRTPGLLLLTATPEQLGMASHFARLRLLDPDRFFDLQEFIGEAEHYRDVAGLADKLLNHRPLASNDMTLLGRILGETEENIRPRLEKMEQGDSLVRSEFMSALLDQHGTGRVMFRNSRSTISGFPKRRAKLHSLSAPASHTDLFDSLVQEFASDTNLKSAQDFQPDFSQDPRIDWLADLLRSLKQEKLLLLCRTQRKVEAIDAALRQQLNMKVSVFHEGLSLVQRDRNAAWFAEADGARLLIASEIGSEGRNFQFAHHLVLFDLPLDPELLEQRIGRLDRIGQTSEIQVHVPYIAGSPYEVLARWFHQGLNSFEKNLAGGRELLDRFGARVHDLAQDFHETQDTAHAELECLIQETTTARSELTERLEQGRDRLLEMNSFRAGSATQLVQVIQKQDNDQSLDEFMLSVFDRFSIHVEELAPRTYRLGSAGVFADSFPGLPPDGFTITGDRQRALSREDVQFLTCDHPLVTGALDLLLGSEQGNSSFARWPDQKTRGIYLEAVYLLECIAPPPLHADRFLPPTPLRVLVDHCGQEVGSAFAPETLARQLKPGDAYPLLEQSELREELLPSLIEKAHSIASCQVPALVAQARTEMTVQLKHEIARLKELQKVNRSVQPEEVESLVQQQRDLDQHLSAARLRLDAIRLIQRGPL